MKKAVFIDGASLSAMRQPLGIAQYNWRAFREILNEIGEGSMSSKPYLVLQPRLDEVYGKRLRTTGFHVEVVESEDSKDDEALKEVIQRSDADVFVIVSADQDFAPVLADKVATGKKVFWVATRNPNAGFSMISSELEPIFKSSEFTFIELADYKDRIMHSPWKEREKPTSVESGRRFRLEVTGPAVETEYVTRLIEAVSDLAASFPEVSIKFEV